MQGYAIHLLLQPCLIFIGKEGAIAVSVIRPQGLHGDFDSLAFFCFRSDHIGQSAREYADCPMRVLLSSRSMMTPRFALDVFSNSDRFIRLIAPRCVTRTSESVSCRICPDTTVSPSFKFMPFTLSRTGTDYIYFIFTEP